MATTMKLIAKNLLTGSAADVTFSSIPSSPYTDLCVVCSTRSDRNTGTADNLIMEFNGSTSSYTYRALYGTGSAALSLNASTSVIGVSNQATNTSSTFSSAEIYIPNYAGSTNKSSSAFSAMETNASSVEMWAVASLWSDTAAITSIKLKPSGAGNWVSGSSFFLYGITKA
jgi:hypothetical protein